MVLKKQPLLTLLLTSMMFFVSCAPQLAQFDRTATDKIYWPGAPEIARIAYVWSVSSLTSEQGMGLAGFLSGPPDTDMSDPRSANRLIRPYGIFVDELDRLFITDPGASRVTLINIRSGEVKQIASAGDEDFLFPIGVIAFADRIVVSDSLLKKIFIFDAAGKLTGTFEGEFERPTALALDAEGKFIYVSDTLAHTIYKYNLEGKRINSIGKQGAEKKEFNFPTHLWVDAKGLLYVTDSMNFRVQIFSPQGEFLDMFGALGDALGNLEKPKGIATDRAGNIYVIDSIKDMVKMFNRQGKLLLFFGGQGRDYGQLSLPSGIFIRHDFIYVADTYNSRVQAYRYLGADKQ